MTKDLVTAYVSSGIDISNAEELAKVSLIDSVRNNSNVESVKLAMSIGKFDTIEEVLTKIVSVPQNTPQVFFANKVFNHRGRHFRGRRPFNRNEFYRNDRKPEYRNWQNNGFAARGRNNFNRSRNYKNVNYCSPENSKNMQASGQETTGEF